MFGSKGDEFMDLYDAMSTLRAVRRLRPDPIAEDVVERILTAATWAPTGGNTQPWRIVALTDPAKKQALQDLYKPHWDAYVPGYQARLGTMPEDAKASSVKALDAGNYLAEHMHEAPLIAVFCFNPKLMAITDSDLDRPSVVGGGSVYPAVQNFLLACRNEGLGCVITTLLCYEEAAVKELLGMPEDWYTCAHIPVGYPILGGHGSIRRRGVEQMVRYNQW
jgi:nitroreductase